MLLLEEITDQNKWISSVTNGPINTAGAIVQEGDADAILNPNFGAITTVEHTIPDVSTVKKWSALEFKRLFTANERVAVRAAATQNAYVYDFLDLLDTAIEVIQNDPDVIAGATMLKEANLISQETYDKIVG